MYPDNNSYTEIIRHNNQLLNSENKSYSEIIIKITIFVLLQVTSASHSLGRPKNTTTKTEILRFVNREVNNKNNIFKTYFS